jgi:beta-lactamase regulating signal transducer with metallopeptidase domain
MSLELAIILKGTLILGAAALLSRLLSRASAAVRHGIWAAALSALVILPAASWILPALELPLLPAPPVTQLTEPTMPAESLAIESQPLFVVESVPAQGVPVAQPAWTWKTWVSFAWGLGALVVLVRLVNGGRQLRRLRRESSAIVPAEWSLMLDELKECLAVSMPVELRLGGAAVPPMTWGAWRHVILLPAGALAWPEMRVRLVIAHELAHVKRSDGLTQVLAQIVWSLYWFNPAVWYANHRLRFEQERACDDHVLNLGAKADDYADHLLQIARGINFRVSFATLSAAHPSQLESRLLAILDSRTRRQALSRFASAGLFASIALLAAVVAVMQITTMSTLALPVVASLGVPETMTEEPQMVQTPGVLPAATTAAEVPGSIEVFFVDDTGGPVADISVRYGGRARGNAITDESGKILIKDLPPGTYSLTPPTGRVSLPDVSLRTWQGPRVTVAPGQHIRGLRVQLVRAGAISGRITDERGNPVVGAEVRAELGGYDDLGERALRAAGPDGITDENGAYRLASREPGSYYVSVLARGPTTPAFPTFYPAATVPEDAAMVAVAPGADVRGINISLPRVNLHAVKVKIDSGAWPVKDPDAVFVARAVGRGTFSGDAKIWNAERMGDGLFVFRGAPPGSYEVEATWSETAFINALEPRLRFTIRVADRDVDLGTIVVPPPRVLKGRVTVSGNSTPAFSSVVLSIAHFSAFASTRVPLEADGSFVLNAVPGGHYGFRVRGPEGLYPVAVRYGGQDVLHSGLRLDGEPSGPIEVLVGGPAAGLKGFIRNNKDEPVAYSQVVLIPAGARRGNADAYFSATSDQLGGFSFENIPSGEYGVLAWDYAIARKAYVSRAFLEPFEKFLTRVILSGGATSNVSVRAITKEN